ncbi:hypothetical protein E2C01_010704 [Portunus trituberculatus]|uniref:Endonuclease/exonuclease/phosphatase domain-containing protein n=1 Tax=Portunus trituberculatus TaxID=210409 RepID=A0A5B7D9D7_PORTR|nr:hypothetical protein [Portunus trituberculatus]
MEGEAELGGAAKRTGPKEMPCFENQRFIKIPVGLKRLSDDNTDKDFSGFREEREISILGDFNVHHQLWLSSPFTDHPDELAFNFAILHDLEQLVQDSTQELDQEVEELIKLEKFIEQGRRPMKVRMRSQVAVEEIMTRKGKLADDTEFKDIWIKRDMNLEEREKEKVLRNEAKDGDRERICTGGVSRYESKEVLSSEGGGHERGKK